MCIDFIFFLCTNLYLNDYISLHLNDFYEKTTHSNAGITAI